MQVESRKYKLYIFLNKFSNDFVKHEFRKGFCLVFKEGL